jgi:hypothetical protein
MPRPSIPAGGAIGANGFTRSQHGDCRQVRPLWPRAAVTSYRLRASILINYPPILASVR